MKKEGIISLMSLFILTSCGEKLAMNRAYNQRPAPAGAEESSDIQKFTVQIFSLSEILGSLSGSVDISINQTDVSTITQLTDVPQNLMIGQRSISNFTCSEIAVNYSGPEIEGNTIEFKDLNLVDSGTRETLIAELNQADPHNGDSVNLVGKSYVIKAYVDNLNPDEPQDIILMPIACGSIQSQIE